MSSPRDMADSQMWRVAGGGFTAVLKFWPVLVALVLVWWTLHSQVMQLNLTVVEMKVVQNHNTAEIKELKRLLSEVSIDVGEMRVGVAKLEGAAGK